MPQGYNEDDFAEMQRQAIKRVKEMQQRAKPPAMPAKEPFEQDIFESEEKESIEADPKPKIEEPIFTAEKKQPAEAVKPKREPPQSREQPKQPQRVRQKQGTERNRQGLLSSLFKLDSDISLILPLLLLLGKEGADDILLLALLYIMA